MDKLLKKIVKEAQKLDEAYCVTSGKGFRLKDYDPGDTGPLVKADKPDATKALAMMVEHLTELQDRLYAQDHWAVLLIFQAMDAAGKDSTIKHVMSGVNPQGCQVTSFKAPSDEDLDHDYLWRCAKRLPERGFIGIFNRSYYEEVLVLRVHPELLERQKLPRELAGKHIWHERYQDIRKFERYLGRNGVLVRKFFLHVSLEEQKRRFLERLDEPEKNWKFSERDVHERAYWDDYMNAYERMIRETATKRAPWYVVPADHKWYTHIVVAAAIVEALASLDLRYPELDKSRLKELAAARKLLLAGK